MSTAELLKEIDRQVVKVEGFYEGYKACAKFCVEYLAKEEKPKDGTEATTNAGNPEAA